uniref:Uncharacterized protein n=1 Tax=Ditylenchus dipsaci TaxID=166011 RepID=A0A915ENE7_9BILA
KNLAVDFAKTIWHLPLNEKAANETINVILRMFESIARDLTTIINLRTPAPPRTCLLHSHHSCCRRNRSSCCYLHFCCDRRARCQQLQHDRSDRDGQPRRNCGIRSRRRNVRPGRRDAEGAPHLAAAFEQEMLEEDHESHEEEESSSSSSPSNSEGSDGEGANDDEEEEEEKIVDAEGN